MVQLAKFSSIEQFRNVVKHVDHTSHYAGVDDDGKVIYDRTRKNPTIRYIGTVKLHGCVHEDTLITLADGSKEKIKDIKSGTSILSYNEISKEIEFDIVNDVIVQYLDKPWIELFFDNDTSLKCTCDHPILTQNGWVKAIDLTPEHNIIEE